MVNVRLITDDKGKAVWELDDSSDDDEHNDVVATTTNATTATPVGNVVDLLDDDSSDDDSDDDDVEAIQSNNKNNTATAAATVAHSSESLARQSVAQLPPTATTTIASPQRNGNGKRLSALLHSPIHTSKRPRPLFSSPGERKHRFAPYFNNDVHDNDDDDVGSVLPEAAFSSKHAKKPQAKPNAVTSNIVIITSKADDTRNDQNVVVLDSDDDDKDDKDEMKDSDPNAKTTVQRRDSSQSMSNRAEQSTQPVPTNAQSSRQANQEVIEIGDDDDDQDDNDDVVDGIARQTQNDSSTPDLLTSSQQANRIPVSNKSSSQSTEQSRPKIILLDFSDEEDKDNSAKNATPTHRGNGNVDDPLQLASSDSESDQESKAKIVPTTTTSSPTDCPKPRYLAFVTSKSTPRNTKRQPTALVQRLGKVQHGTPQRGYQLESPRKEKALSLNHPLHQGSVRQWPQTCRQDQARAAVSKSSPLRRTASVQFKDAAIKTQVVVAEHAATEMARHSQPAKSVMKGEEHRQGHLASAAANSVPAAKPSSDHPKDPPKPAQHRFSPPLKPSVVHQSTTVHPPTLDGRKSPPGSMESLPTASRSMVSRNVESDLETDDLSLTREPSLTASATEAPAPGDNAIVNRAPSPNIVTPSDDDDELSVQQNNNTADNGSTTSIQEPSDFQVLPDGPSELLGEDVATACIITNIADGSIATRCVNRGLHEVGDQYKSGKENEGIQESLSCRCDAIVDKCLPDSLPTSVVDGGAGPWSNARHASDDNYLVTDNDLARDNDVETVAFDAPAECEETNESTGDNEGWNSVTTTTASIRNLFPCEAGLMQSAALESIAQASSDVSPQDASASAEMKSDQIGVEVILNPMQPPEKIAETSSVETTKTSQVAAPKGQDGLLSSLMTKTMGWVRSSTSTEPRLETTAPTTVEQSNNGAKTITDDAQTHRKAQEKPVTDDAKTYRKDEATPVVDNVQTYRKTARQRKNRKLNSPVRKSLYYESEVSSPSLSFTGDSAATTPASGVDGLSERDSYYRPDDDDLNSMNTVEHLCRTTVDDLTGLPIYHFTVYSVDETLFEFRVDIRQSSIPNAGFGAFLTFLGAKVLKPEARRRAEQIMNERDIYIPDTLHPLTAESPDGFGIELKLTGCNLHGNGNSVYWPKHLLSSNGTPCLEKIAARGSEYHMKYVTQGIGFLGIHKLDDYKNDPKQKFCSRYKGFGVIDLGRYGPFRKEDRNQKINFDLKSFIFGHVPSEWCFGVEERLHGQEQIIDITDDVTGEPHQLAKAAIPMYVNEVGHNRRLKQNVFAKEKDERTVQYFLNLSESMAKGETVELLVDYFEVYELVRERKGYGMGNLAGGLKSDEHPASALKRNFSERKAIEDMVNSLSIKEMYYALEFLSARICSPIVTLTESYLDGEGKVTPTNLQWLARRRLHWLSGVFMKHLIVLEGCFNVTKLNMDKGELTYPYVGFFEKCKTWLEEMKWPHTSIRKFFSEWDKPETRDDCTPNSFSMEVFEEVLFDVRNRLIEPLDESVWCPLARNLITKLCRVVASVSWTEKDPAVSNACLRDALIATGKIFIKNVIDACDRTESAQLEFSLSKVGWLRSFQSGVAHNIKRPYAIARSGADDVGVEWIPVQGPHNTSGSLNKEWYLLWQVLFILDVFATEYCAGSAQGLLEGLCTHAQLNLSVLESARTKSISEMISTAPRLKRARSTASNMKRTEGGSKQSTLKEKPKKSSDGVTKPRVNNFLFFQIVWACLTKLGWTLDKGNRPTDYYFLPPGVRRERGFTNRRDYFDSCLLVLDFIRNDGRWRDNEEVKASVVCLSKCSNLLDDLRRRRKLPKGELKLEWLLKQLEEQPGSS